MDIVDELNGSPEPTGEALPVETPVAEAPAEAQPEPQATEPTETDKPSQPRGPDGKFARKEPEEPVMVPLKALHETRDEVKALKAQLEALNRPQQQQPQVPDMFADPEGFQAFQNMQLLNTTLNLSESMAKRYAGADAVEEAKAWAAQAFASNPALYQQFIQQPDPYGFIIDEHKKASTFAKLGSDPSRIEAFLAWEQAQANPQPKPQAIPTSLAADQSARGAAVPYQPPSLDDILRG